MSRALDRPAGSATGPATTPAEFYEMGLADMRAGRYLDAQLCCRQALALDPAHADTLHLMGLLSFQAQHYDHAVEWMSLAIRQNPRTEYLAKLANALLQCRRAEDALK